MSNPKIQDIVVVFLCCAHKETEDYLLKKLVEITDKHFITTFDFGDLGVNPPELFTLVRKEKPDVKLLILLNNNPRIQNYFDVYKLHIKFEEFCKSGVPIITNPVEEALFSEFGEMEKCFEKTIISVRKILEDPDPLYFSKNIHSEDIN